MASKSSATKPAETFSAAEKAAMKERAKEAKAAGARADGEKEVLAKIAALPEPDRAMAKKVHELVKASAPQLSAKTWYGMPAYANKDDKIVVFFQDASKFKARYATLGFNEAAKLDDGNMWQTSFALLKIGAAEEKRIVELVKRAAGA